MTAIYVRVACSGGLFSSEDYANRQTPLNVCPGACHAARGNVCLGGMLVCWTGNTPRITKSLRLTSNEIRASSWTEREGSLEMVLLECY